MNKDIQNENYDLNFSEFYELYLNAVDIPKGVKKKSDGLSDYTQYKAIIDLDDQCYYFMKYGDAAFMKACLDSNSDEVEEF